MHKWVLGGLVALVVVLAGGYAYLRRGAMSPAAKGPGLSENDFESGEAEEIEEGERFDEQTPSPREDPNGTATPRRPATHAPTRLGDGTATLEDDDGEMIDDPVVIDETDDEGLEVAPSATPPPAQHAP
jgi:hypothetical protein